MFLPIVVDSLASLVVRKVVVLIYFEMSEAANANNCINCNLSRRKFIGKVKRIITEDEVIKYQAHCSNTVTIGSVFCNKCRLNVCRAQRPERVIDEIVLIILQWIQTSMYKPEI